MSHPSESNTNALRVELQGEKMQIRRVIAILALITLQTESGSGQSLTTSQAKAHEGETATVCGKVAGERTATSSRGQPTFINLDVPYPSQVFTILVWGEDRAGVGTLPKMGDHVCAKGRIEDYRGVPEIVVKSKDQLGR